MSSICEYCTQEFSNKYNLARHQKKSCKDNVSDTKKHKCKYCLRYFLNKNNLERHKTTCPLKKEYGLKKKILESEQDQKARTKKWKKERKLLKTTIECSEQEINELKKVIEEKNIEITKIIEENNTEITKKDQEIAALKVECEKGKIEVYDKICAKVLDKPTVTNTYIHPKLINLPITTIHPLTPEYVQEQVANGNYGFDHYLKGEDGLVEFIYSITMCENEDGEMERNYVCTDPSRDSYHRLVETKEWQKDKGGKFMDVILDTLSGRVDGYHHQLLDERIKYKGLKAPDGYDPDYVYKKNNDMHSGVVQVRGTERRSLRQRLKKETSQKITV